ncbi:kinetochore Sim4 complex subunit FTA2-domain-containing protein [Xylaria palmicola]|nr:kinetochore Sim4 complex subunit FTA2-domain-containing protein [Xylaria palmicola]
MMADLIPDIKGPKLSPFSGALENIEFLKELGPDRSNWSSDTVPHSRVFLVRIEGTQYSLKVFNFFSLDEIRPFVFGGNHLLTDERVRYHLDPFYAECRAFGLLREKNKDHALAVRCHGYAFLSQAIEDQILEKFRIEDWNRQHEDEGRPLRAIIKDYIRFKSVCGRKRLSVMRSTLKKLNDMGIYNMDVREANYLGGRLFDFSVAITPPHLSLWLKLRTRAEIQEDREYDLAAFDDMAMDIERERASKRARWSQGALRPRRATTTRGISEGR